MPGKKNIDEALKEAEQLMNTNGVHGVGIGKKDGKDCINVFTSLSPDEAKQQIPKKIQGFEVVIEFTGPFQAYDKPE
jgi:hypothetical protein